MLHPGGAVEASLRAIELDPGYADAHCSLGAVLQTRDRLDEAFEAAEELMGRAREDTVGPLLAHLVKRSDLSPEALAELRQRGIKPRRIDCTLYAQAVLQAGMPARR